jgi:ABC-type glycerol-3-phosphate transport system substrate-binding protein
MEAKAATSNGGVRQARWTQAAAAGAGLVLLAAGLLLAACAPFGGGHAVPASPAAVATTAAGGPLQSGRTSQALLTVAPAGVASLPITVPQMLTLTMWTTEVFCPTQGDLGSQILKQQVAEFTTQNPRVGVQFTLKKAYGPGGVADFLLTTGSVVPQALPDLAIVDMAELPVVARAGLIRPLSGLISAKIQADLFPFALRGGTVDGQWVGLIFEAEVLHLAYNMKVTAPPVTWTDVLSGTAPYVFAAGGNDLEEANESFWLQYLAGGGSVALQGETPTLDVGVLESVFGFYHDGAGRGVILKSALDCRTDGDSWSAYLSGKAALANVSSLRFLASRSLLPDTGFAPVPTRDGKQATVASGWALVIVAKDPAHQEAAARLIEWLLTPERSGAWTRATNRLPATRQALATWDPGDAYTPFVRGLLEAAQPTPGGLELDAASKRAQRGIRDVLSGTAAPKDAATAATGNGS